MYKNLSTQQMIETILQNIHQIYSSESYQNYLKIMSHFSHYSFNNIFLIYQQDPQATYVASYRTWQLKFHRNVRKGEKAIYILAPIRKKQSEEDGIDTYFITGYRRVAVFDIRQTAGEELPKYMFDELHGNVNNYAQFCRCLKLVSPCPLIFSTWEEERKGYYDCTSNQIFIRDNLSEIQTIKTQIHEIAHSLLHKDSKIEAESIAYCICHHYGIDTAEYSFPYIAGWASQQDLSSMNHSLKQIQKTTDHIIRMIDQIQFPNHNHP